MDRTSPCSEKSIRLNGLHNFVEYEMIASRNYKDKRINDLDSPTMDHRDVTHGRRARLGATWSVGRSASSRRAACPAPWSDSLRSFRSTHGQGCSAPLESGLLARQAVRSAHATHACAGASAFWPFSAAWRPRALA